MIMEKMEKILSVLDNMLNTKQKRHIIGGALLSVAIFFGGLAITTITIKNGGQI